MTRLAPQTSIVSGRLPSALASRAPKNLLGLSGDRRAR